MVDGDETADEEFQLGARQVRKKRSPANTRFSSIFFRKETSEGLKDTSTSSY